MPLTDKAIKAAFPKEKIYRLADGEGMYLEIHPNGSKYWRMKYYFPDEKRIALGVYPAVSLADARQKRAEAKKLISQGIDPRTVFSKGAQKLLVHGIGEDKESFEYMARRWLKTHEAAWTPRTHRSRKKRLENDVFPIIGAKNRNQIKAIDVLEVGRDIEKRGANYKAKRVLQMIGQIYSWGTINQLADINPAASLSKAIPAIAVKHNPHLREKDLPDFLAKLDALTGHDITRYAVNFLLITFVRTSELRHMNWEEVHLAKAEWRIPPERMKMAVEHIVPLPKQAIDILDRLKPFSGGKGIVFRSPQNLRKPISENTILDAIYRMGYKGRLTGHGFRGTASTILNEHGFNDKVVDKQLAHKTKDSVSAAYNHALYLPERRKMMQWWADFIDGQRLHKEGS